MPLKFCANLTFLFNEKDHLRDRYAAAKDAGFSAVEIGYPYNVAMEELATYAKDSGMEHVLINLFPGNQIGDDGLTAIPGRSDDFKEDLEVSIAYAKTLNCPRLHLKAGRKPAMWTDDAMDEVYLENVKYAAERCQKEEITVVLEAISPRMIPHYFLDHPKKAIDVIKKVQAPNLKLQLDIFHLQLLTGDLTESIKNYLPYTDHIQIAQVPDRHEPSSEGEINYKYILSLLEKEGYSGWIGLEYKPSGNTSDSFHWIKEWGYA